MPHRVSVSGTGYAGTVAAACLAYIGHDVIAVESDNVKLDVRLSGRAPFFEPCLDSLIGHGLANEPSLTPGLFASVSFPLLRRRSWPRCSAHPPRRLPQLSP